MYKYTYNVILITLITSSLFLVLIGRNIQAESGSGILPAFSVSNVYRVNQITGEKSTNSTAAAYNIFGTDLGITWDDGNDQVMVAFGDTYGEGWSGCGAGPAQADWRSNVLALSSNKNPEMGLSFTNVIQGQSGQAAELIPSKKLDGNEITTIPTAGISVGGRNFIYFMSVNNWDSPGVWHTNYSGIAYSDDNGQSWTVDKSITWQNNTVFWNNKFQQVALVKDNGFVYMFGTPNGRFGAAALARVKEEQILTKSSYEYWDGTGWQVNSEKAAVPVASGPVAELSVQYNSHFNRWLMTYLDETRKAIVLRDAPSLTGPWSDPQVLVSGMDYPQLYGAFIHPWFNQGTDLYFNMSQWCSPEISYNVSFMHASLNLTSLAQANSLTLNQGHEQRQDRTEMAVTFGRIWKQPAQGDDFGGSSYPTPLNKMNGQVN